MKIVVTDCEWKNTTVYGIEHGGRIIYIGKTSKGVKSRISSHWNNAFSKKGRLNNLCPKLYPYLRANPNTDDYTVHILGQFTPEDGASKEIELILKYETKSNGLNVSSGGNSSSGPEHYLYGKKVARHIVDASVAARIGKPLSEEHKAKQRAAHAANRHLYSNLKKVKCDQTDQVWDSIAEASRFFGVRGGTIQHRIKNKEIKRVQNKALGGLTFSYVKDNE